jgi:hypothetical protein
MRISIIPNSIYVKPDGNIIAKGIINNKQITIIPDKVVAAGKTIKLIGTVIKD